MTRASTTTTGNPLFVRELVQSMLDTANVLDLDAKNNVATFGPAAAAKLHDKNSFPACARCNSRPRPSRTRAPQRPGSFRTASRAAASRPP